jgi:hypothetical protein
MKGCFSVAVSLSLLVGGFGASSMKTAGVSFGPHGCVKLNLSPAGTCVITTDCAELDTTNTEFAFNCVQRKSIVRHSFGVGGFEEDEEFDTNVKCDSCAAASAEVALPPVVKMREELKKTQTVAEPEKEAVTAAPAPASAVAPAAKEVTKKESPPKEKKQKKEEKALASQILSKLLPFPDSKPDAVKYGPNGCVSTHKNKDGHCMITTDCKESDMSDYEYGLVCVDKVGSPVKHLFGKDSFDAKENFDTLLKCEKCLGLEDIPDAVTLAGEVATMAKDISSLNSVLKNISLNVKMLDEKVFPSAPAPAPAAAGGAPVAAAVDPPAAAKSKKVKTKAKKAKAEGKALLSHHRHHHRHLRHHHRLPSDDDDDIDRVDDGDDDPDGRGHSDRYYDDRDYDDEYD